MFPHGLRQVPPAVLSTPWGPSLFGSQSRTFLKSLQKRDSFPDSDQPGTQRDRVQFRRISRLIPLVRTGTEHGFAGYRAQSPLRDPGPSTLSPDIALSPCLSQRTKATRAATLVKTDNSYNLCPGAENGSPRPQLKTYTLWKTSITRRSAGTSI